MAEYPQVKQLALPALDNTRLAHTKPNCSQAILTTKSVINLIPYLVVVFAPLSRTPFPNSGYLLVSYI